MEKLARHTKKYFFLNILSVKAEIKQSLFKAGRVRGEFKFLNSAWVGENVCLSVKLDLLQKFWI